MITTLFQCLSSKNWLQITTICNLHKPCVLSETNCLNRNFQQVIDFDKVKDYYCSENKIESCASVDAISSGKNILYFIEIKGWKEYLNWNTGKISSKKIDNQINRYNLEGKLRDSLFILSSILKDEAIENEKKFKAQPKQYILVTDIYVESEPINSFAMNLAFLAAFSSDLDHCWTKTNDTLSRFPTEKFSSYNLSRPILFSCKDLINNILFENINQ